MSLIDLNNFATTLIQSSESRYEGIVGEALFSYTGALQTWVVPAGVTSVVMQLRGGRGGDAGAYSGGWGGVVETTYAVTPGDTLNLYVGNQPTTSAGGYNGGGSGGGNSTSRGGGGATDVRIGGTALSDRVAVAGGGGAANPTYNSTGGGGGNPAGNGYSQYGASYTGKAGTHIAGGAASTQGGSPATAGALGVGGNGGSTWNGPGGGGGYYGGGGGAAGGGGGGSSWTNGTSTNYYVGFYNPTPDGSVYFTYSTGGEHNPDIDGNVFFDLENGRIEFLTATEAPTLDLTSIGGGATDANPLTITDGIKLEAVYAFEKQERHADEVLRAQLPFMTGDYKFAGAYSFINSRKPAAAEDRSIIRGSGWNEIALDKGIDRIYFGNKGLSNIGPTSQPYYQIDDGGEPFDFAAVGQIDEAVQILGYTGNVPSDSGSGDFDNRVYEAVSVRTYGQNYDRKKTTTDLAITELGGFSTGFALQESGHLTTGSYALADVYGGAQVSPWTGMTLEKLVTAQTETGFVEADGDFTWVLSNSAGASLDQCIAFLDALAQTDDDIDTGAVTVTNGKRVDTWYSYNASGKVVTRSGADSLGLYIEQIPTADEQRIVFTDDSGATKTNPSVLPITVNVSNTAGDPIENARVYMVAGSGGPQTLGTLILNTLTSASGIASGSSSVASDQPVTGWVRKASGSPFYKTNVYSTTIDSDNGVVLNIIMLDDE
jgi:hypothetical protein